MFAANRRPAAAASAWLVQSRNDTIHKETNAAQCSGVMENLSCLYLLLVVL